jgi:hypothetical protein
MNKPSEEAIGESSDILNSFAATAQCTLSVYEKIIEETKRVADTLFDLTKSLRV